MNKEYISSNLIEIKSNLLIKHTFAVDSSIDLSRSNPSNTPSCTPGAVSECLDCRPKSVRDLQNMLEK